METPEEKERLYGDYKKINSLHDNVTGISPTSNNVSVQQQQGGAGQPGATPQSQSSSPALVTVNHGDMPTMNILSPEAQNSQVSLHNSLILMLTIWL